MGKRAPVKLPKNESPEQTLKRLSPENRELIELVRAGRKDPVFFAEKLLGLKLHDGQKCWLWMTTKANLTQACELGIKLGVFRDVAHFFTLREANPDMLRNLLIPSNRWGKTFVTTVKHLWYNFYKIGVRGTPANIREKTCGTLNLSPHSNQCDAGYQYIIDILCSKLVYVWEGQSLKNECKIGYFLLREEKVKRKIHFANNTSYRAVPTGEDQASSLAGTPYLYISYDECAQSLHLKQELPAKIMSRLIDFGGPLDLVSTPEVDRPSHQYFFHIAKKGLKGEEGWFTMIGKIFDNNFLGEREREQTLASIKSTDPAKYRQVAFGEFVTTGQKMFDSLVVERIWDQPFRGTALVDHKYLLSADWGFADTGDPTVFLVLDFTFFPKLRIAHDEEILGGSPFAVFAQAKLLQRTWNNADFIHDASALGGVIIKKMLKEMDVKNLVDFQASGGGKPDMLFALLAALTENRRTEIDNEGKIKDLNPEFGQLRSYHIPKLEEQLGNYAFNPDKGVTDKKLTQDYVMCLGQAIWYLLKRFNKLNQIKNLAFNPLANSIDKIFTDRASIHLGAKQLIIEEKRIY